MNTQLDTIFGKIKNQISANLPLKHFTLSLINMYINDQVKSACQPN